jgi:hypothetical protein
MLPSSDDRHGVAISGDNHKCRRIAAARSVGQRAVRLASGDQESVGVPKRQKTIAIRRDRRISSVKVVERSVPNTGHVISGQKRQREKKKTQEKNAATVDDGHSFLLIAAPGAFAARCGWW